jgi:sigma-B regulation protein RsbU (phosphoserine phosphatase)
MDEALLKSHPLLAALPPDILAKLQAECQLRRLAPGETVLVRGQENDTLFFVLSGSLRVHVDSIDSGNGFDIPPGDIIGELSIVAHAPATGWVVASEPVALLEMPEAFLWKRYMSVPEAARALICLLIGRARRINSALLKEFAQKLQYEVMRAELESAARIQSSLLPRGHPYFPEHPGADAHAIIRPAREVGGDFFDVFPLGARRVCVAVGDVSGKGLPAALFMVRVVTLLRMTLVQSADPAVVLPTLNRFLCQTNDECMFVTLAIAILDTASGQLAYLNAGHNPPYLSAGGEPFRVSPAPKGSLLGVNPDATFALQELQLRPSDTIILYTDGVTEAENEEHALFCQERALGALNRLSPGVELPALLEALSTDIARFVGAAPQSDDITSLALRYLGSPARGMI